MNIRVLDAAPTSAEKREPEPIVSVGETNGRLSGTVIGSEPYSERYLEEIGMTVGSEWQLHGTIAEGEPNSNLMSMRTRRTSRRDDWNVEWRTDVTMTSTPSHFVIEEGIEALADGVRIFAKRWNEKVERRGN